jgi:hypothetical protein
MQYLYICFVDIVLAENARVILCVLAMWLSDTGLPYGPTTTCVFLRVALVPARTFPPSVRLHGDMSKDDSDDISR